MELGRVFWELWEALLKVADGLLTIWKSQTTKVGDATNGAASALLTREPWSLPTRDLETKTFNFIPRPMLFETSLYYLATVVDWLPPQCARSTAYKSSATYFTRLTPFTPAVFRGKYD